MPLLDFEKRAVASPKLTLPIRKVLSNGLTVLVIENKNNPTISMSGFVRAGGSLNPPGKEGLASLTAEMLDKGTTRRDKLTLARDLDFVSAQVGFSGRIESTSINASCLSKDLDRTLGVLAEELTLPAFPKNELLKAKADWITSIRQSEERPEVQARRAFNHQIFPLGHPYRELAPAEKIAAIEEISQADLKAFHLAHYGPNAVSLAVVGDVKAEEVCAKLERLFKNWGKVAVSPLVIPDVKVGKPEKTIIPMMDKSNVVLFTGNPTAIHRRDPDYYAATTANYILGGDPLSARLGVKLRDEMGLTYSVGSSINPSYGATAWNASITVNPANVETAIEALRSEIKRFVNQGVTAEELAKAKSAFIGGLAVGLSTNAGMASSLSSIEFFDLGTDYWSRCPKLFGDLSLEEVNRAARKMVLPEGLDLAIAGPYQEK
ncbi:MAG TPA: hypothetical protein DD435_02190 [Cyanobacteria bacterium UBA8530]|nr:hypothetical protein [Cyanobacteria bacterium UBA8530]